MMKTLETEGSFGSVKNTSWNRRSHCLEAMWSWFDRLSWYHLGKMAATDPASKKYRYKRGKRKPKERRAFNQALQLILNELPFGPLTDPIRTNNEEDFPYTLQIIHSSAATADAVTQVRQFLTPALRLTVTAVSLLLLSPSVTTGVTKSTRPAS